MEEQAVEEAVVVKAEAPLEEARAAECLLREVIAVPVAEEKPSAGLIALCVAAPLHFPVS